MHEFSLCQSIIKMAEEVCSQTQSQTVNKVFLRIGTQAGVDMESLRFWFPVACKGTLLAHAALFIDSVDAMACCCECKQKFLLQVRYMPCPTCGSFNRDITCGQEMLIEKIEVE